MYNREEIKAITAGMQEGKTYAQIMDEMYPISEYQCMYDCALENMRSFSLIGAIYNFITKKEPSTVQRPCTECYDF
ncbi:hypothetical protein Desdi_0395 [Desulfitobacterium dichloroeliminans LMG P-21439]|uniref:Uncharacterized protein n=1 Tax=Desulfitobacterium dichloroeliminans (strain LMG P-21439 / DCA1) TaxID=871963 RepID=L0F5L0_DESDL|nr:hypothetical protein [Desulfitobacterium dichloroeliminans]AGA67941.1 hypothetical protein Desdi_0395 [Desulfitobacterium dichloroeliminans LMG P-21439]